jgi:hypothetical protein
VAISSHGTTFSFSGITGLAGSVVSISVEEAQGEVVDMTSSTDYIGTRRLVSTGDITTPPKVSIEYFRSAENMTVHPPTYMSGIPDGILSIGHGGSGVGVSRQASVESASTEMAVGDFVRGKITFVINVNEN